MSQVLSLTTGVRTFAKVELGGETSSLVKTVNCKEGIIISSVGGNQATRRWQGGRPVEWAPSLVRGALLQPEGIITS